MLSWDKLFLFSFVEVHSSKIHLSVKSGPLFPQELTQRLLPAFSDRTGFFAAKLPRSTD